MKAEQQYIDLFSQCEAMICRHSAEVLNAPRAKAFADFERLGFPTRKQEKYKYTEVSKYFAPDYGLNLNRLEFPVNPYEVFKCDVPNMSTSLYFVVNDAFDKHVHPSAQLPEGVIFGSLKDVAEQHPELVKKYYGKLADTSKDGVVAFNTMFAQDGVLMYVPKNVVMERPVQLVNILRADVNTMVNRRILIILEEGAQAKLLICDHAMDEVNFLSTQVVEAFIGENAVFDLYELEETHNSTVRFNNLYVHQEANSNVLLNGMTLHNGTTRNTTEVTLAGRGAEVNLCGMAIADKNEQVDNNTFIDHQVSDCTSNELFKYVLDDQAVGAFAGKVLVREGAQHTSSQQTNRNICATREARMYTQPQLEIYADDVKCSHGATVGQLDENALFYMRQRGISLKEARLLLMFAFVNEVIDNIRMDALKDRLHLLVVSDCTSNELFKYVLDDQAVGAFAGKVLVREGAQHTSSQQTNRNICATREARMYTQPQLEIYADDVKCSHGATVGQLDENALFYMRQRGISLKEARLLLMFAFVNEVIDNIRMDALKDRLHLLVEKRFRGELNKCQGCAICK